jgi:hypothetical protein
MSKEKRTEMIGALVPLSIKQEVEAICATDQRSISTVSYMLLMRGLELYRVDGLLTNNERLTPIIKGLGEELHPAQASETKPAKQPRVSGKRRRAA